MDARAKSLSLETARRSVAAAPEVTWLAAIFDRSRQEKLDTIAGDSIPMLSLCVGIAYAVLTYFHLTILLPPLSYMMAGIAGSSATILFAIWAFGRRKAIRPALSHPVIFGIGCIVLLNSGAHLYLSNEPFQATNFILTLLGSSLFFLSIRWFAAFCALIYVAWIGFAPGVMSAPQFNHFSFLLFNATAIGFAAFAVRRRSYSRIIDLLAERDARETTLSDALHRANLGMLAEQNSRAKSEFLANMSHELRTPLNAIIGFSEIMMQQMFGPMKNDKYMAYTKDIHSSGQHLLSLVDDVLDLSKIEVNAAKLAVDKVEVESTLKSCLSMVSERAARADVGLHSSFDPDFQILWTDERRLKQVILNLLSNAIKFTPPGGQVRVRTAVDSSGKRLIQVSDTGIGMNDEEVSLAVTPFWQAENALTRSHGGAGLGLPLASQFAQLLGGWLEFDSKPGRGTTVNFWLPPSADQFEPADTPAIADAIG